ncbi:hypothetical protein MMC25_007138 [Agyrium rufum]|nr:hypothetical protein [Agyrium rufum]
MQSNGFAASPAALLNPKAASKGFMQDGLRPTFPALSAPSKRRHGSEPASIPLKEIDPNTMKVSMQKESTEHDEAYISPARKARANSLSASNPKNTKPISIFDPRALLNPRNAYTPTSRKRPSPETTSSVASDPSHGGSSASSEPSFVFASSTNPDDSPDEQETEQTAAGGGLRSFIEKIHNVEEREARPMKKPRLKGDEEDEKPKSKAQFAGGKKSGELGQYIRDGRKEGQEVSGTAPTVVDLTLDDSNDDVQIIDYYGEQEVCFGRVDKAKVQAHAVPYYNPKMPSFSTSSWPLIRVTCRRVPGTQRFWVLDEAKKDFGTIDVQTARGLVSIDFAAPIRLEGRLLPRKKDPYETPGMVLQVQKYMDLTLNLYGKRKYAQAIGRSLSQRMVYLHSPLTVQKGFETVNPHAPTSYAPSRNNSHHSLGRPVGAVYAIRSVEEIRNDVTGVFNSLQKSQNLPEMAEDPAILTELLPYQKQGLYFMTKREKPVQYGPEDDDSTYLWRQQYKSNGLKYYLNVITGHEETGEPPQCLGGILADEMGLGKTLSILSLIVSSLADAREFGEQDPPASSPGRQTLVRNSKATLLVAPLSTIVNWEEQIKDHIAPGTLKSLVYHGHNRCECIEELAKYDVVITTYAIVANEFSGRSKKRQNLLTSTNFFRIVLDEAHIIREQSTMQSRAVRNLAAQRRWAVTGTPVQNRLDDLGALIKFLRIKPFYEGSAFNEFILSPFKAADPEILPKLRVLVDGITLRRLKTLINLPDRVSEIIELEFSPDEKRLYNWFKQHSDDTMRVIVRSRADKDTIGRQSNQHVLQAIMRLRRICAHGKELLGENDLALTEGFNSENAIDLDNENQDIEVLTERQAHEMLMLLRETNVANCVQCGVRVGSKDDDDEDGEPDKTDILCCMLPCYQILCGDCRDDALAPIHEFADNNEGAFDCPYCHISYPKLHFVDLTYGAVQKIEDQRQMARDSPRHAKLLSRYEGPHSKTKALLQALAASRLESEAMPDEKPIKSVVFSGWTSHLDLIQIALEESDVGYARLDGSMNRNKRNEALRAFREDDDVVVILVSISAGGHGLNLITGSKVYMMEPQFNPALEMQAADRVHRLGQKRDVHVVRYIMKDSFEEKILRLQRRKMDLADLATSSKLDSKADSLKKRMEELRDLFK